MVKVESFKVSNLGFLEGEISNKKLTIMKVLTLKLSQSKGFMKGRSQNILQPW